MEEYLDVFRQTQSIEGMSMALGNVGAMSAAMGDFERAAQATEESFRINQTINLRGNDVGLTNNLASVDFLRGNLVEARQKVETAIRTARETKDKNALGFSLLLLGKVICYEDHPEEGQAFLEESRRLIDLPNEGLEAELLLCLGHAAALHGDYDRAAVLIKQSLEKQKEALPGWPARCEKLADAALHLSQPVRAARLLGAAEKLRQTMGAPIPPVDQAEYGESLRMLSTQLDEKQKERVWNEGAAMSLEEIFAFALGEE